MPARFFLRGHIEQVQAAIFPGRTVAQEDHAIAIGQCDRILAAAPGLFELGQADLDRHDADRRHTGLRRTVLRRTRRIDWLRDEIAGLIGGAADAVEASGFAVQRVAKIRAVAEIPANESPRRIPVAGRQRIAVAIHQIQRPNLGLALYRLQRAVESVNRDAVVGPRQHMRHVRLKCQRKWQRLEFFQHRFQIERDDLKLSLGAGSDVMTGLVGGKQISTTHGTDAAGDGKQDQAEALVKSHSVFRTGVAAIMV